MQNRLNHIRKSHYSEFFFLIIIPKGFFLSRRIIRSFIHLFIFLIFIFIPNGRTRYSEFWNNHGLGIKKNLLNNDP